MNQHSIKQLMIAAWSFMAVIAVVDEMHAQDLSYGLVVNDLSLHPMQEVSKPAYLDSYIDPSFGTRIRRISDAGLNGVIVPMYSTIQAWNADESLMILYNQSNGTHMLLDGVTYEFIRNLNDISPADIEQLFWHFDNPDILYFPDSQTNNLVEYTVSSQTQSIVFNFNDVSGCVGSVHMGNDIQMMSWDNNTFAFRCQNETTYAYRIDTNELIEFDIDDLSQVAVSVSPSGNAFYHNGGVYTATGELEFVLNQASPEHSCIGKMTDGGDAHFSIAFAQGPDGGCIGDIIAHDLNTGACFPLISQSQGFDYPQSGTHISALAHKNSEGGWLAASMIGYDEDGQDLLDQELVIAKADAGNVQVCRIGHHRSDENEYDYWGEPHAVISPTGTRVLFASDWSGVEDGQSIDSYVVELPAYDLPSSVSELDDHDSHIIMYPNPVNQLSSVTFRTQEKWIAPQLLITDMAGRLVDSQQLYSKTYKLAAQLEKGVYRYRLNFLSGQTSSGLLFVR